jgi:uncharacterized protein
MMNLPWSAGSWTHRPVAVVERGGDLLVTAAEGSDAWRLTSYGFVHDSEHALLAAFPQDSAMEVEFTAAFSQQFDQAGIFVRVSAEQWVKAGVEFADGYPSVGAVVTKGRSDWCNWFASFRSSRTSLLARGRSPAPRPEQGSQSPSTRGA